MALWAAEEDVVAVFPELPGTVQCSLGMSGLGAACQSWATAGSGCRVVFQMLHVLFLLTRQRN